MTKELEAAINVRFDFGTDTKCTVGELVVAHGVLVVALRESMAEVERMKKWTQDSVVALGKSRYDRLELAEKEWKRFETAFQAETLARSRDVEAKDCEIAALKIELQKHQECNFDEDGHGFARRAQHWRETIEFKNREIAALKSEINRLKK